MHATGLDLACAAPAAGEVTLQALAARWSVCYRVSSDSRAYYADRTDGALRLTAETVAELDSAIQADWARWFTLTPQDAQ
jgi:hypothetical protein